MEWDIGAPWYRPTRVYHVISGAEFGFRNGSGKWPDYAIDSFGTAVDIGPGSPTGVTFGYGAKFPAKYQEAFYIADWSFGKLRAVHLTPSGASYTGEAEDFVSGQPLAVTDLVINPKDGAMYFAVGGRNTQSALYRLTYVGNESTAESKNDDRFAANRELRRKLESFHGRQGCKGGGNRLAVSRGPGSRHPIRCAHRPGVAGAVAMARQGAYRKRSSQGHRRDCGAGARQRPR